jgi:hypothetical protein
MSTLRRRVGAAVTIVAVAGGLAACGAGSHRSSAAVSVFDLAADPARNIPAANPRHPVVLTVAQVHAAFDTLLSQHVTLVAALMHEVGAGQTDVHTSVAKLAANTQSLTDAIAVVYGTDAARAFAQLWEQHSQFFVDYAQATRDHDDKAKDEAEDRLHDYQNDFASFVTTATAGGVPLVAVTDLLHGHVDDLTRYIAADVAGDSTDAGEILRQAQAHKRVIAKSVADAIAAQHLASVTP